MLHGNWSLCQGLLIIVIPKLVQFLASVLVFRKTYVTKKLCKYWWCFQFDLSLLSVCGKSMCLPRSSSNLFNPFYQFTSSFKMNEWFSVYLILFLPPTCFLNLPALFITGVKLKLLEFSSVSPFFAVFLSGRRCLSFKNQAELPFVLWRGLFNSHWCSQHTPRN